MEVIVKPFHSLVFLFLFLPISSSASFTFIKDRWTSFVAWTELKYDRFMGLQPSFKDLKEFKKIQDKYDGNLENYYFGEGIFKKISYTPCAEQIKHLINNLPNAPEPDSKLSKCIINYIKKELNKAGIIPEKVFIKNHEKNKLGSASFYIDIYYSNEKNEALTKIVNCTIEIDNGLLGYFSKSSVKGLINHEITHLINFHGVSSSVYLFSLKQSSSQCNITKIMQEISIACEYQADLLPGINNKKNAKRALDLQKEKFKDKLSIELVNDTDTHPSVIKRYQKIKQLCNFHTIKDQMETYGMSIDELINRFKAHRQEMRIN